LAHDENISLGAALAQIASPTVGAAFTVLDPKADVSQVVRIELVDAQQVSNIVFRPLTGP
jgi:hypothetical protein